jgi:hypothetical protein
MTSPFYDLVPKDMIENLKWRIRCRERALTDIQFRNAFWQACMEDVCFFMSAVCYGYDPRAKHKIVPFIPYPHQEYVFNKLDEAIDYTQEQEKTLDVLVDKARAQGGTFGYLWVDLRRWLRDPMFSAGYVTRNADLVDSKTDSDTVLWKVQFALNMLPAWMRPQYERNLSQHTFENKENGALLKGYAAGQDVAAGGRATVFTMDEAGAKDFVAGGKDYSVMEALHDVTNCAAEGTLVVTDHGLVEIEKIELFHRVWDGTMWVSHDGCVYQGEKETISSYGVELTPDHQVLTKIGWRDASVKGLEREEIRLPNGYREEWPHEAWESPVGLSMRLREQNCCYGELFAKGAYKKLRMSARGFSQRVEDPSLCCLDRHEAEVLQPEPPLVSPLRGEGHKSLRAMDELHPLSGRHGGSPRRDGPRQNKCKRRLRKVELQMVFSRGTSEQQKDQSTCRNFIRENDGVAAFRTSEHILYGSPRKSRKRLVKRRSVSSCTRKREEVVQKKKVYDLLNCGPRAAFTVIDSSGRPLLIHNCLRLVSARYVDQGVFHEACEAGTIEGGWHLILDWKDHPVHSKHSYIVTDNIPKACKPEDAEAVAAYHKSKPNLRDDLERKGFKYEGVVRSPWYDMRCLRKTARPQLIASQLDRNPKGAVGKVFMSELLDRMRHTHGRLPVWRGIPVFEGDTLKITGLLPREDGPLSLWFKPGIDNSPPLGPFTIACDIASGGTSGYASNSVASGIDDRTGEQVLEYVIKGLEPRAFAKRVVGLCLWMRKALLGWEDSGVSSGFAKEVMEVLYYGNVYYRDVTQLGSQKKSRKPGFPSKDADKADMFEQLALGMHDGRYTPRSLEMLTECGEYEWKNGKVIHGPTQNRGATDKNHGDRAIAAAGAWLVFSSENAGNRVDTDENASNNPEYGSFLWREQQEAPRVDSGSPRFSIRDLLGN